MRKHGYGYLEVIVVRRADNVLYRFKEGDFPRLRINDIEDMLILVVQNWLTNLAGDDVADFPIALRTFTEVWLFRSESRICNLELKVDALRRLYKITDGTLTRLLSSLEDITWNIEMEYLPKRRWSTLEKKRAHFMIKDINKLLKERRMMRSLEKFISGRLYGTDLRLLQRTILLRHIVHISKVVRHRYSNPMIQPEPEGSTQGYPLVSVEVLRHDTKGEKVRIGNNAE
ncbi:hypothetical protein Tco_0986825 [Tanacetum coccineum]